MLDIYSQSSEQDSRKLKALVYGLFLIETAQVIVASHDSFHQLALSWGVFSGLANVYLSWLTLPVLTGISTSAVIVESSLSWFIDDLIWFHSQLCYTMFLCLENLHSEQLKDISHIHCCGTSTILLQRVVSGIKLAIF